MVEYSNQMQNSLNDRKFNHFKIHTQYSICEGAIKIDDLKNYCKTNKVGCIGLSDTHNLSGALEFSENISKQGTKPLIGTQIRFKHLEETGLLTLIAKNEIGYKKIIELSSKSFINNTSLSDPYCNFDELVSNQEDIIVMSGTINGLIGNLFIKDKLDQIDFIYKTLVKKFNNNFYIEIQRHGDKNEKQFENFNLKISHKYNIPIIASHEVFYIDRDMHDAHEALICIGRKMYLNDKNRHSYSDQHYLKPDQEMKDLFSDLPQALENNFNLSFRCNFRPLTSKPILPNISSVKEGDADTKLRKDSINGLNKKLKDFNVNENGESNINAHLSQEYEKRLEHELKIITEMKYSSYFLIVADYINWAKKNDIPVGPGRGSGAGSLVAWCLNITDVDPLKFNLIFERFLNPSRISLPDFDIDFCEEKRDLVFNYLSSKYKNRVAHIITFGKLKARMVIRDVGRVIGLSYGFVDSIAKMIPFDPSRPQNLTECINSEPRLQKMIKEDSRVKKLIDLSLKLEGLYRNVATHAAGVVISDKDLTNSIPLYKDQESDLLLPSTQFDMYSAENAGLIKFDFLGLKTLTVIDKTQKLINMSEKKFNINNISYSDGEVFKTLSQGNTVGLFQLESSGMKDALVNMKPTHLEDIIALVALYRPGPMSNIPIYNDCKNGVKKPDYIHPLLEDILKPTYGVIIYQEQIMQIAQKLSGFTAAEADILRKAIGKKKRAEVEKQKARFIDGAVKNGIAKDVAAGIFLKIEPFAEYGFNKSHAAAYAIIAYQTAFLKTYFPKEFFAASMTMDISNQKKLSEFYEEISRLKINVIRPDINECYADFKSSGNDLFYALGSIKNVGFEAVSNIVKERELNGNFKSINDFIKRVNPKDINKLQLEGLVKAGAFDSLNSNRSSIYNAIPYLITKSKNIFENKLNNQIDLFGDANDEADDKLIPNIDDWTFETRLSKEFEAMGFFISDHPLNEFKDVFEQFNVINYKTFLEDSAKINSNIAATILKIQERKTNKGLPYAVIKFSDLSTVFELFVFSETLVSNREMLKEGNSLLLSLSKNNSDKERNLNRINISKLSLIKDIYNKPINKLEFITKKLTDFKKLSKILNTNGNTEIKIKFLFGNQVVSFDLKNNRKVNRKDLIQLKNNDISHNIL